MFSAVGISACNPADTDDRFCVKGVIYFEDNPLSNVEILINNKSLLPAKYSDESGNFFIDNLSVNDIVTFKLEGYSFNSYTIKLSNENVIIVAVKSNIDIKVIYDSNIGAVTGIDKYKYGEKITLSAIPNEYVKFIGFYNGSELLCSDVCYTFIIEKPLIITAKFEKIKYLLTIENTPQNAIANGDGYYYIGDTVTLTAEDTENYIFSNWVVNDKIINDKVYCFVFESVNDTVSANFIPRLNKPDLDIFSKTLLWNDIDNVVSYNVYLDNKLLCNTENNSVNLNDYIFFSGDYILSVVAVGSTDFADSIKSDLKISYIRPLDTPAKIGFLYEGSEVYVCFSKINGATDYHVFANGKKYALRDFVYNQNSNTVSVNITKILIENISYEISITACGNFEESESLPTDTIIYSNTLQIPPPEAEINGSILTWSHNNIDAKFNLIINGIRISLDGYMEYDLSTLVESGSYTVIVEAEAENYRGNSIKLNYTKT